MKVIVTGFEPFGGEEINPSALVAERLQVEGIQITPLLLPTEFKGCSGPLLKAIRELQPDWVVMLGQAAGRTHISLERLAVNLDDARIPDNAGHQPREQKIYDDAPAAYFSTLPVQDMIMAIHAAGVPAAISNSAGTYVCNHLFFTVMDFLARNKLPARAGFIHIPLVPGQALDGSRPAMALDLCVMGIEAGLAEMCRHK